MNKNTNRLAELLSKKGYSYDKAIKIVAEVLDAMREEREENIKMYLNKRGKAEFDGLLFDVVVRDIKIDNEGKVQWQVTPLNGSKHKWVKNISFN